MPSDPVSRGRWRAAQNSSVAVRLTAVERGPKPFQDPVPHAFAQRVGSMSGETPNVKTYRPFTPKKRPAKPVPTGYEDRLSTRRTSSDMHCASRVGDRRHHPEDPRERRPCHDREIKIRLGL